MSKFEACMEKYLAENEKRELGIDPKFLRQVAKSLGPSIYKKDAETVSSSSKDEMETVRKKFLIKKLGLKDTPKLDEGMAEVIEKMGKGNRKKYRALVYALLAMRFRKKKLFADK